MPQLHPGLPLIVPERILPYMPRPKRPHVASVDEVRITRKGDSAIIEYADPNISTTHFGPFENLADLSDQDILDRYNEGVLARQEMRDQFDHVAVEVPLGQPQIEQSKYSDQLVPRGDVLRCVISDGGDDGEATVWIDDRELSLQEFGKMLTVHAGWGMRIVFVPEDSIHEQPVIEVREPTGSSTK